MAVSAAEQTSHDRREEVLAAAAECFMRRGYEATSMDDVAAALGATKGRVYHHFKSKPDLFLAVFRRAMEINREAVTPHATAPGNGAERLKRMAIAHVLCMMQTQPFQRSITLGMDLYRFGATEPEHRATFADLMDLRRGYERLFRGVIEDGMADRSLRSLDAGVAVNTLLGALNWVVVWYTPRPGETPSQRERLAETVVATALGGYRAGA